MTSIKIFSNQSTSATAAQVYMGSISIEGSLNEMDDFDFSSYAHSMASCGFTTFVDCENNQMKTGFVFNRAYFHNKTY